MQPLGAHASRVLAVTTRHSELFLIGAIGNGTESVPPNWVKCHSQIVAGLSIAVGGEDPLRRRDLLKMPAIGVAAGDLNPT